jgi:ethanolamine ammonia-lyase large subunit
MTTHDLRSIFALANAFKEGDLAVGGTRDDLTRHEARRALLATTVAQIRAAAFVDDGITAALTRSRDRQHDADLDPLTIADIRALLLAPHGAAWAARYRAALASEVIAAVAKVMTDDELSSVARSVFNPLGHDDAIGSPTHFGSRIQPNSPGDDDEEILFSILEGLSFGCGDVIIGLNPASDDVDTIVRLEELLERIVRRLHLPTRYCVLSDIVKQHAARAQTRIDVGFQSLAGTSRALGGMVGLDIDGLLDLARAFDGLYFETGQGSAVTNGAAEGVDMVTLEARAYGVARHIQQATRRWTIVNDVAGFIGPEVFRTPEQLERACLEDSVMAKLHGLTMGLDVCATFHMGIAPSVLRALTSRIAQRAAPAYLMAVAGNADPMLGYLTTSFREHPSLRRVTGRDSTTAMRGRLSALGVTVSDTSSPRGDVVAGLYASYAKAGGESRSTAALADEGRRQLDALRERGFDLGIDDSAAADARVDRIYSHARAALYAPLDDGVLNEMAGAVRVNSCAGSRDDYLSHPDAGERLRDEDARGVAGLYSLRRPHVQLVVSDGLNANGVNEQLRSLLAPLRRQLTAAGHHVGEHVIVVRNGRVRAGYEVGGLTGASIVVHVIGERPGTGLNTVSVYLTYGRTEDGRPRWSRDLDHSATTAVCGIHPRGKPPAAAVDEVAGAVARMTEQKRSGVALQPGRA